MRIFRSIEEWLNYKNTTKLNDLGFVPTMGALHEGHISLVKRSKKDTLQTLVSIFVNPTQFNNPEDLDKYPNTIEDDIKKLESEGVDYLLLPNFDEIYPDNYRYKVQESEFSNELCGAHRPGHFDGVLSIVMKLLNIASAKNAYFGEKDYQQYLLIKDMCRAFFMDVNIIACPIIREESGLAMSSRNMRLSENSKNKASEIYRKLSDKTNSLTEIKSKLEDSGFEIDYLVEKHGRRFIAASIENIRLIDNV